MRFMPDPPSRRSAGSERSFLHHPERLGILNEHDPRIFSGFHAATFRPGSPANWPTRVELDESAIEMMRRGGEYGAHGVIQAVEPLGEGIARAASYSTAGTS
jgi:hypothetical protein